MNIYLVEDKGYIGYDQFDSAVVLANDEEEAKGVHCGLAGGELAVCYLGPYKGRVRFEDNIILGSFNAG